LCSRLRPSLLRKCDKDSLMNFDLEKLCKEWSSRAPIFYSFLITAAFKIRVLWLPSIAVSGSVLLKQRHPEMNATANVIGILLKTKSLEVSVYIVTSFFLIYTGITSHFLIKHINDCHIKYIFTCACVTI